MRSLKIRLLGSSQIHEHVRHFLSLTSELERSRKAAPHFGLTTIANANFLTKYLSHIVLKRVLDAAAHARESQVRRALHVIDPQLYRPRLRRFSTFNARDGFQSKKLMNVRAAQNKSASQKFLRRRRTCRSTTRTPCQPPK